MKFGILVIVLFYLSISSAFSDDDKKGCSSPETIIPTDAKTIEAINNILIKTKKEKKSMQKKDILDEAKAFFNSLPQDQHDSLHDLLSTINNSKTALVQLVEADGDPLLLVQGVDKVEFPPEWIRPFHKLLQKKQLSFYFKWEKAKSIEENRDQLISTIKSILEKYKDKNLTIIGYSAGGIITTFAMDALVGDPISQRIYFHTIATPFFGYNVPGIAVLGIPFVGKTTIQIGRGSYKNLKSKKFKNCTNWVNTNCKLDEHTCVYGKFNPQLGPNDSAESLLPCGYDKGKSFDDENHFTILNRAFSEIVK